MNILLCLSLMLGAAFASTAVGNYSDPKHPGKCVISPDLILSPGVYKNPLVDCGRIICSSSGLVQFQDCGVEVSALPGCTYGDYVNKSLSYPACCERKLLCLNQQE